MSEKWKLNLDFFKVVFIGIATSFATIVIKIYRKINFDQILKNHQYLPIFEKIINFCRKLKNHHAEFWKIIKREKREGFSIGTQNRPEAFFSHFNTRELIFWWIFGTFWFYMYFLVQLVLFDKKDRRLSFHTLTPEIRTKMTL